MFEFSEKKMFSNDFKTNSKSGILWRSSESTGDSGMGTHPCREENDLNSLTGGPHSEATSAGLQHQSGGYPSVGALGLHPGVGQLPPTQEYHGHAAAPGGGAGHGTLDELIPWNRANPWATTQAPQTAHAAVNNHHMSGTPGPTQNGVATFNDVFPPAPAAANGYLAGADFGQAPFYYPAGQFGGASLRGLTL